MPYNIFLEFFYVKKVIKFFDDFFFNFFISHKSGVKIFLKWYFNNYLKGIY